MEHDHSSRSAAPAPAPARSRPGCRLFAAGLLSGMLLPLLLGLLLLLDRGGTPLQPTPPPPGEPDIVVSMSRSYIQRSAERSAAGRAEQLNVRDPVVTLAPHPQFGARMVVHGQVELPLLPDPSVVATLHLAAVDGELRVETERLELGQGGRIPLPGQSLIKDWVSELVNEEVEQRVRANPRLQISVTAVSATEETLIITAMLSDR